ncbi:MAG: TIGR03960 family B12-binding radical SAM protein [Pseudomonadota bacterium]
MDNKYFEASSIIDQPWFSSIRRPSRYIGNEVNAIKKDLSGIDVSIALAYPDVYEVGMSHLGLKILYHMFNSHAWLAAERVFCPWVDLEKELRERGLPLTTLESSRPLSAFDIVGFSLQHELTFTNILTMLDLSGIAYLSEKRDRPYPLIIAGGPVCFNPEPVAPLFDAIVIGEGEEAALEICKRVKEAKSQKIEKKADILRELARIRGVYVPSLFKVHYESDSIIREIEPIIPELRTIKKAIVQDIDRYPIPVNQVVPFTELIHDRLAIEIARGCSRSCRFCQAGMIYRPVRERNPRLMIQDAEKSLRATGFEDLSFLSLSSGDYSCIGLLLKEFMDRQSENRIAVNLPSLRIDSLNPEWFDQIKRVRKTGFTLAPEAGSDSLRAVINKTMTNGDVLNIASKVYEAGWNLIKLYFMIGLPTEEEEDLHDIIHLSKKVVALAKKRGKKSKLNVSIATFVPKSHTPFMWAPQISLEESQRRIQLIQNGLRSRPIHVKWNSPKMSWLEGIFARGDRRLTNVLIGAFQMGARFDAWSEHFNLDLWKKAFKHSGLNPEFYIYRSRPEEEILPWDHIECGVRKDYLRREWKKALERKMTPDCREKCLECGVCDQKEIKPILYRGLTTLSGSGKAGSKADLKVVKKYRCTFQKMGGARHLSHLELVRVFIRAFKRADFKLVYSRGYHPLPRVSFLSALPVGTESLQETMDIEIYDTLPPSEMKEKINQQLPPGIQVLFVEEISHTEKRPRLEESHFSITMDLSQIEQTKIETFLGSDYFPVTRNGKNGNESINARPMVKSMSLISPSHINLVVRHTHAREVKPLELIKAVFGLDDQQIKAVRITKAKQVMG